MSDLRSRIEGKVRRGDRGEETTVSLTITSTCNLACRYCFAGTRDEIEPAAAAEAAAFVAGEFGPGAQFVPFGRETLSRPELLRLVIRQARERGLRNFFLCTNATLIDEKIVDFFEEHRVHVTVSLDGVGAVHDEERVTHDGRGSFARIERNLRLMRDRGFRSLTFRVTASPRTCRTLDETYRYVAEFGFERTGVMAMPAPNVPWSDEDFRALRAALARVADAAESSWRRERYVPFWYNECLGRNDLTEILFHPAGDCGWSVRQAGIATDGSVYTCYIPASMEAEERGAFRVGSVREGVPSPEERARRWNPEGRPSLCGSCHFWNQRLGGDPFRPLPVYRHFYAGFIEAAMRLMTALHPRRRRAILRLGAERLEENLFPADAYDSLAPWGR